MMDTGTIFMNDKRRQKLIDLGAEVLADALLKIAEHSTLADNHIDALISAPEENLKQFRQKLASLKRSDRYFDWRETDNFARELSMMLQDLKAGIADPLTGAAAVIEFFEADSIVFEMCDDSSGSAGMVFTIDARDLFVEYASRCPDKEKIAELVLRVSREDEYGVRDALIDCAGDYLSEPIIRQMIEAIRQRADTAQSEYRKRDQLMLITSLAHQIKNAELLEETFLEAKGKLSSKAIIDIASIHRELGDFETAIAWLNKIPESSSSYSYEREKLLLEIYRLQGSTDKLTELLYKKFRSHHTLETLQALLDVIGGHKREEVIAQEAALILGAPEFRGSDAEFLLEVGRIDETETYIISRADKLYREMYYTLLPLAEGMESHGRYLAASLIYRSLLVSILKRGYSKAYSHGVQYLKKLDTMAAAIDDWKTFDKHKAFTLELHQNYSLKRSFWARYANN